MDTTQTVRVEVGTTLDVFELRRALRAVGQPYAFGARARQCLELVATELATNILKHGVRGHVLIGCSVEGNKGPRICLEAHDLGPRIENLARALVDGSDAHGPLAPEAYWGRPGIGAGLGAIARLSDDFSYEHTGSGNRFVAIIFRDAAERRLPGVLRRSPTGG